MTYGIIFAFALLTHVAAIVPLDVPADAGGSLDADDIYHTRLIWGCLAVAVVFVLILGIVIWACLRSRKTKREEKRKNAEPPVEHIQMQDRTGREMVHRQMEDVQLK